MNLSIKKGIVQIGDYVLPGVVESISVGGSILIDSAETDAVSGVSKKICRGFDDKTISISIRLFNDENIVFGDGYKSAYDYLSELEEIFSKTEKDVPRVYKIISSHTEARKIKEVLFSRLESEESNEDDTISVMLEFTEFIPAKYKNISKEQATTTTSTATPKKTKDENKKPDTPVEDEPQFEVRKRFEESRKKGVKVWK